MNADQLIASVPHLPAPAPTVTRLLSLLARPDADNQDVVRIVQQDGVMSGKLLGLCNSAAYGLATQITSVEQAVLLLGQGEIHKLVLSLGFSGALAPAMSGYAMNDGELWRHSLMTAYSAVAVTALARRIHVDPAIAYTAGLLHDIGKIVINHAIAHEVQEQMRELVRLQDYSLLEAEMQVLGTDHAKVGARLLQKWGLPEVLIQATADHHQPVLTPRPQLSAVVHAADTIAHEAGTSPGWASFAVRAEEGSLEALELNRDAVENLIITAYDARVQVEELAAIA